MDRGFLVLALALEVLLVAGAPSSLLSNFSTNEKLLISAQYLDFSTYDDSTTDFLADTTTAALASVGERLILGLYRAHIDLLENYLFDPPNFSEFPMVIWVNPLGDNFDDLSNLSSTTAEDNTNITGNSDILIALSMSGVPLVCEPIYGIEQKCGTFLEIHRPFDETILFDTSVSAQETTLNTNFLSTKYLCGGKYEVYLSPITLF